MVTYTYSDKGRMRQSVNLKTGISRKQSTPKFPKNKHFLPLDTHTCAYTYARACTYQEVRNVCFSEILACSA